jgi:hypothetical protein
MFKNCQTGSLVYSPHVINHREFREHKVFFLRSYRIDLLLLLIDCLQKARPKFLMFLGCGANDLLCPFVLHFGDIWVIGGMNASAVTCPG